MSRRKKENLENCLSGTFRGNEKGFGFVKLEGEDDEVYISRGNTKDALNGDKVLIKIINEDIEANRREGEIVDLHIPSLLAYPLLQKEKILDL